LLERAPRAAAISIGVLLMLLLELGLRIVDVGDYRDRPDPFAGFSRFRDSFVRIDGRDGRARYVAPERRARTREFLAEKPANGFRIFVFGGSALAGTPYGYDFSFAEFLREQLVAALPDRSVEVVNCAVPGYGSRRLLYLAEEVAAYEPDLFIISTGHNELIEQRAYAHLFDAPTALFELRQRLRQLRLFVLLEDVVHAIHPPERPEVVMRRVYVGMFGTRLDPELWADEVRDREQQRFYALAMFRNNVDRMIRIARAAGAEVLLFSQSKNYADWSVTGSAHRSDLAPEERAEWERHARAAEAAREAGAAAAEVAALERARAVDARYAATHQRLADLYRARGSYEAARSAYRLAHNLTLDNFGTTPERNGVLRELAVERATLWLDMDRIFEAESPNRLVGANLFVDFLHPNLTGQQLIAREIFALLRAAEIPSPTTAWRAVPALASPQALLEAHPELAPRELGMRVVAELLSGRRAAAAEILEQLQRLAPEDPDVAKLARWVEDGIPFEASATTRSK